MILPLSFSLASSRRRAVHGRCAETERRASRVPRMGARERAAVRRCSAPLPERPDTQPPHRHGKLAKPKTALPARAARGAARLDPASPRRRARPPEGAVASTAGS